MLSNTMAREIIHAGLHNRPFIERGHDRLRRLRGSVEAVDARTGRGRHRRAGGRDRRAGAHVG